MATPSWQYRINAGPLQTGREAGILACSIEYASRALDTASLTALPETAIPYRSTVEIWHGGVRRFVGLVMPGCIAVAAGQGAVQYRLVGPWWWLCRTVYRQQWVVLKGDALGPSPSGRVILNQNDSGAPLSVDAQIAEILAYAKSLGVPLDMGRIGTHLTLPWDEQRDITCAQAIERCLRFCPDICSRIDYAPATPVVHFDAGPDFILPSSAESVVDQARDDLVCPGITIEIERLGANDGQQYRTLHTLSAGDTADPDAVHATLQLAGPESSRTVLHVDVVTEPIPAPLEDAAWWIKRHPRLKGIDAADLVFIQTGRWTLDTAAVPPDWVVAADTANYPRISINPVADLEAIDVRSRVERFSATVDIVKRDANGDVIDAEHAVELDLQVVATNATTRTYHVVQSFEAVDGEPVPADLAAQLLAHWAVLYYEGEAVWPMADAWPLVGAILSGSPVQSASVESGRNTASMRFGPPAHLSIEDFAARLQGFRTHRAAFSWRARLSGEPSPKAELNPQAAAPAKVPGAAPGEKRVQVVADADGHAIELDPSTIAETDARIAVRTLRVTGADSEPVEVEFLATKDLDVDVDEGGGTGGGPTRDCEEHPGDPGQPGSPSDSDAGQETEHPGDASSQDPDPEHPGEEAEAGQTEEHPGDAADWCVV